MTQIPHNKKAIAMLTLNVHQKVVPMFGCFYASSISEWCFASTCSSHKSIPNILFARMLLYKDIEIWMGRKPRLLFEVASRSARYFQRLYFALLM